MKKQKSLSEMSDLDLVEALIYDENIQDNLNVSNDYEEDEYGNTRVSISFEKMPIKRKRGDACIMLFVFNKGGRLVGIEAATRLKGDRAWQVVISDPFMDFSTRFSNDEPPRFKKKKK